MPGATACRHCGAPLSLTVVDLGKSPLCQTVLTDEQLEQAEAFYPLHVRACERCWLVQIPQFVPPEDIFTEYAYFSAYSDSWVEHARRYVDAMTERLALGPDSLVVEVASNDGYLLQHFLPKGVPVLGIEPALNVADAAVALGRSDGDGVLRRRPGTPARRGAPEGRPRARQQRPGAGP